MSQESPEKPKRRLKQPTKARLRELVAEQATMIERLQGELAAVRRPWWRRLTHNAALTGAEGVGLNELLGLNLRSMDMEQQDHIALKWGTLKAWHLHSERGQELLKQYAEIGMTDGAMQQNDTPEQKALLCQMIEECNADTIYLDWDGKDVSKEEAKAYVMGYQR